MLEVYGQIKDQDSKHKRNRTGYPKQGEQSPPVIIHEKSQPKREYRKDQSRQERPCRNHPEIPGPALPSPLARPAARKQKLSAGQQYNAAGKNQDPNGIPVHALFLLPAKTGNVFVHHPEVAETAPHYQQVENLVKPKQARQRVRFFKGIDHRSH
eukprot:TRINITY_DN110028_c0_g1_i1.p2 TRINITY_DN110028_c0_g1~~TRINITY_DN110028_c0_g1_i1.p2  ORF type:complete len:165 (-),score=9.05 TRINITY_DN110028_c0_g1_i1:116-580(-)